ncbi:hypothetical protein F518_22635 [Serratia marcescens VGH107]|nr:hypothetical protein F518_22635 [Serratia marcescens VGH107]
MSSMSREEIDAKLGQSKAEAEATAALVRAEIASFREFQAQQFATMNTSLGEIKGSISASNGEIAGLKGHIDGLKTSVSTTQWLVGAILAILAIILAIPQVQVYFKPTEKVEVSSQVKPAAQEQHSATGRDNSSQK